MNTTQSMPDKKFQDARALPAPPAALWTFALVFTISAVWALLNA